MIVTKTNKVTGEIISRSIDITPELLHEVRIDSMDNNTNVLESGRLNHLNKRDTVFIYTGVLLPLGDTLEERLENYKQKPEYGTTSSI